MDISLSSEMEKFVVDKIRSGQYASASEVVQGALALLKEDEQLSQRDLDELREEIGIGIDELDQGKAEPWDSKTMKEKLRTRLAMVKTAS
jgi:antitoxin ParD1/3/4